MDMQLERPTLRRVNVGPRERKASMAAGLAMLTYLVSRRPDIKIGLPMGSKLVICCIAARPGTASFIRCWKSTALTMDRKGSKFSAP